MLDGKAAKQEEYDRQARDAHPPEFAETEGEVRDEEGNLWNPQLHILMHATVLRQIDEWDVAAEVFEKLQKEHDLHEHAAIHALATVTSDMMFEMMQGPLQPGPKNDGQEYRDKHKRLIQKLLDSDSELFKKHVAPHRDGTPPDHQSIQ